MSSQVAFYYGGNLDNTKPFSAGAVYFDTVKKQIWYDDPSGKSTTHTLLTSLGEISEVTSLPSSAKHKDIVLLKTLVSDQTYTYQLNIYDEVKKSWTSLTKNIKDTDVIFTGTTSGSLTKGKNLSENISNLQSQLLTQLSGKEPTISLTSERAVVSNTSGKLAASAVTATELGYLSGVTSKIQSQLDRKAPKNHASTGTTYGTGTASQYGHLKLSDDTDSKSDVTAGYAATPKAVNTVYNLASGIGTQAANSIISLSYNNTTRVLTATKNNANTATITLPIPSDSVFGLVKSGGDVTITNGIISVKDDSHNHVISNIDGLETELAAKVAKTGDTMIGNLAFENNLGFVGKDTNGISYSLLRVSASNNLLLGDSSLPGYIAVYNNLSPSAALTKTLNLGASDKQWKSLYISDSISDGTNTATIKEIGYLKGVTSTVQTQLDGKADKEQGILYIEGGGTTDTTNKIATWTGTHADIKNYFNGLTIAYKIGTAGSTTTTLNINNLGAVTVVKNVSTGISTSFAVNSIIILTYTTDGTTPYWKIADYDTNTRNSVGDYRKNDTKLYFVGTTSSDASTSSSYATSYTNSNIYVNTDNVLYSAKGFQGKLIGNADTATIASKVNITRPSKSILEVAGDMALFSEEIYFFGSDGLLYGAPVNYVIINAKKGANHRTILDCYDLQTGDHYINGCMNAQTDSTVSGANVWTGWVLQPNPASLNKKQDALMGTANRLLKSASDSKIAVSSIAITETTSGDTTTITFA